MGFARVLFVRDLCTDLRNPWRAVLSALASHENEQQGCRCDPSLSQLAEDTGIPRRRISDLIDDLVQKGYVRVDRYVREKGKGRRSNQYHFTVPIDECYARLDDLYEAKRAARIGAPIREPVAPILGNQSHQSGEAIRAKNAPIRANGGPGKLNRERVGRSYETDSGVSTIAAAENRTNGPPADPGPAPEGIGWTQTGTPFAREFDNADLVEWCIAWVAWHEHQRRNGE